MRDRHEQLRAVVGDHGAQPERLDFTQRDVRVLRDPAPNVVTRAAREAERAAASAAEAERALRKRLLSSAANALQLVDCEVPRVDIRQQQPPRAQDAADAVDGALQGAVTRGPSDAATGSL